LKSRKDQCDALNSAAYSFRLAQVVKGVQEIDNDKWHVQLIASDKGAVEAGRPFHYIDFKYTLQVTLGL
jgi:hypothetical protein